MAVAVGCLVLYGLEGQRDVTRRGLDQTSNGPESQPPEITRNPEPSLDQIMKVPVSQFCFGDIDGNGLVNVRDVSLGQASIGSVQRADYVVWRSDVNRDGVVDESDVQLIERNVGCSTKR